MTWEMYDRLIEPIPDSVMVDTIFVGAGCTMVRAGCSVGAVATHHLQSRPRLVSGERWFAGISWREAASLIRSWNFMEAGIGAAAVNAFYNRRGRLEEELCLRPNAEEAAGCDTFAAHTGLLKGKKVATVGHFRFAEASLAQAEETYILEREPGEGDYPDTACEYILPEMDYVFITGFTLVNKTLPRLLELSQNAAVILVGPSVPVAPVLMEFGVKELAGTLITDPDQTENYIRQGSHRAITRSGCPVRVCKKT